MNTKKTVVMSMAVLASTAVGIILYNGDTKNNNVNASEHTGAPVAGISAELVVDYNREVSVNTLVNTCVGASAKVAEEENKRVEYINEAQRYIDGLSGVTKEINQEIFDIRESTLTNEEKVCKIGRLLVEKGDITYSSGSNLFGAKNTLLDEDFEQVGCYYKQGMKLDCSAFMQYLIWVSTGNSSNYGILIGRSTYFASVEGVGVDEPTAGTLCFHFNGGSLIKRTGETIEENEVATSEWNHVAVYLGDGEYLDCSESYGGIRIVNTDEKPEFADYFTWYRNVLDNNSYITTLEMNYYD